MDEVVVCSRLLDAIQSPSESGLRTGFATAMTPLLRPLELVRGGIAFGDWKVSETMIVWVMRTPSDGVKKGEEKTKALGQTKFRRWKADVWL